MLMSFKTVDQLTFLVLVSVTQLPAVGLSHKLLPTIQKIMSQRVICYLSTK